MRAGMIDSTKPKNFKAIEADKSIAAVELNIARHFLRQKKYRKAIAHADNFMKLPKSWQDPSDANGHFVKAQAYHFLGDETSFEEHAQEAIGKSSTKVEREFFEEWLSNLQKS